jgi:hypothetical protein
MGANRKPIMIDGGDGGVVVYAKKRRQNHSINFLKQVNAKRKIASFLYGD